MLNLNDAYLFVEVVRRGGFASAARALKMPKSTLSTRIARLEAQLDARLIQRTSRRFGVTVLGQEFYRHAAAMLVEAIAAEDVVACRLSEPSGTVHLSCSPGTAHAGLATVVTQFAGQFPGVQILQTTTNRGVDLVAEGIDIAVRAHEKPLPSSPLVQRRVGFSPRWLIASASYIARAGAPSNPDDLVRHGGLCMQQMLSKTEWTLNHERGAVARVRVNIRLCMDDPLSLKIAALQGGGIAAVPAGICRAEVEAGTLVRVLPAMDRRRRNDFDSEGSPHRPAALGTRARQFHFTASSRRHVVAGLRPTVCQVPITER